MRTRILIISLISTAILGMILLLCGCLEEGQLHRDFVTFAPVDINDGWQLSTPSAEGIDSLGLVDIYKEVYNHPKAWTLRSMLVIRNGKLIAESYLKSDKDRLRYNAVWSCTKQVTGIMTGIALNEGFINSIHDSIHTYLGPELTNHQDKKNITIEQILTMTAGINFNNDVDTDVFRRREVSSSVDFVLGKRLAWTPGTHFNYNDGTPQLLSAINQKQTGKNLAQYTDEKFFSKIGLTGYTWADYTDGISFGAFGLAMPPRELAKIAQCVCNHGVYNSEQILPPEWLDQMLTVRVPDLHGDVGFGYLWWVSDSSDLVHMWGHGGQYAVIIPSKNLVVVFTAIEQLSGDFEFGEETSINFTKRIADLIE